VSAVGRFATLRVVNETEHFVDAKKCFERGVRFNSDVEGGGFGLFLAKEIALAHDGEISCRPTQGRVEFTVQLPLVKVIPQGS
jgi:signal transduction histidine kinase